MADGVVPVVDNRGSGHVQIYKVGKSTALRLASPLVDLAWYTTPRLPFDHVHSARDSRSKHLTCLCCALCRGFSSRLKLQSVSDGLALCPAAHRPPSFPL